MRSLNMSSQSDNIVYATEVTGIRLPLNFPCLAQVITGYLTELDDYKTEILYEDLPERMMIKADDDDFKNWDDKQKVYIGTNGNHYKVLCIFPVFHHLLLSDLPCEATVRFLTSDSCLFSEEKKVGLSVRETEYGIFCLYCTETNTEYTSWTENMYESNRQGSMCVLSHTPTSEKILGDITICEIQGGEELEREVLAYTSKSLITSKILDSFQLKRKTKYFSKKIQIIDIDVTEDDTNSIICQLSVKNPSVIMVKTSSDAMGWECMKKKGNDESWYWDETHSAYKNTHNFIDSGSGSLLAFL
jgi:hypothetical protein